MSVTKSNIGATIFVITNTPPTNDETGFEGLTFAANTEIKGMVQGPQFGFTHNMIDIPDLQSGQGRAVKGMSQGMDTQMAFRIVPSDTGQASAKTIADSPQGICSLKLVFGTGVGGAVQPGDRVQYAQGILHSYQENQISGDTYQGFTVSFRQNEPAVESVEPA